MNYEITAANIRQRLYGYIKHHNIKSLVIGISGGIDSCLCAILARSTCDALGIPLIGVSLPSESNKEEEIKRAELTMDIFCTKTDTYFIDELYHRFSEINKLQFIPEIDDCEKTDEETYFKLLNLGEDTHNRIMKNWKIRAGNIKARIRMIYLYNLASMYNGMVICTDNYTEYLLGFWTLHGDVGDYGLIQSLYKSEVYDMAEWIANNENWWGDTRGNQVILDTINALATDGLGITDLGDLGQILPNWNGTSREGYKEVDRIFKIWNGITQTSMENFAIIDELRDHPVIQRHLSTAFKRNNPIVLTRNDIIQ